MADQPHIIDDGFSEPEQVRKIFVGNLPYEADEEMIKTHFSQFGEIIDCVVPRDPRTRFAKGFAFVTYTKGKAVDDVMANRPHQVAGRVLEPKRAISRSESRDPAAAVSTNKLYIGSIGDLQEDELRKYFLEFGAIAELDVQLDKGQAFITFDDHDSVDRAVSKKHTVCGRPVDVRKALTRHQIETATKRRDSQQRRGIHDRDPYPGRGGQSGGGYARSGGYDDRRDPYARSRDPYEDHRRGYDPRGYDRRPYDSYRDRSPPRGYSAYPPSDYPSYGSRDPYIDRYGPPRDPYPYDRYGPPENRYAPPPPRDYDRYGPPPPRPPYDSYATYEPSQRSGAPLSTDDKGAYPPKQPDAATYAHQASVPPEARPGYPSYPPEAPPSHSSSGGHSGYSAYR